MNRTRWLVLALALVASAVTLVFILRPEGDPLTPERLSAAKELWSAKGPEDYDLEVVVSGAREARHSVQVRGGRVVSRTTDGIEAPERLRGTWSVEGMFETLRIELSNARRPKVPYGTDDPSRVVVRAAFDKETGYPRRFMRHVLGRRSSVEWEVTLRRP